MQAAVIYAPSDIRIESRAEPAPGPGEVLIRVRACGVCGTDHSLFTGGFPATYPVVIGHEFAGEVAATGPGVTGFKLGDRVTADPNNVCRCCDYCQLGALHLCENLRSMGVHRDGADAEYVIAPESNTYHIPDSLSYEQAAFTEPLACVVHGVQLAQVQPGDTVVILGAGGIGNLLAQVAAHAGAAAVIVSEPIAARRQRALENGATHAIDPTCQDAVAEVKRIRRIGADVVFEAAGNLGLQASAVRMARKGGTVVWFGCSPQDGTIQVNPFYVNDSELKIVGSFNNPFATGRALALLSSGAVRVDNLVSHRFGLADYLDVFRVWGGPDTLKLMVCVD